MSSEDKVLRVEVKRMRLEVGSECQRAGGRSDRHLQYTAIAEQRKQLQLSLQEAQL